MFKRTMGQETEYAFHAFPIDGKQVSREAAVSRLMQIARSEIPHILEGIDSFGMFLYSGGRFYVDTGAHPELTTPECMSPSDCVRYAVAGDRTLEKLARKLTECTPDVHDAIFYKCNVDYSGAMTTWGCHESYLHAADPKAVSGQMIPHLASRMVYAGAGGFNNRFAGIEFLLSPRMPHIVRAISPHSTHDRGIFHTKDESLCQPGYHRLHVLCGESLCSHLGMWLKFGTTALVLALVEAGVKIEAADRLPSSLAALRRFARDPQCTASVKDRDGNEITAVQLQRAYLEEIRTHVGRDYMPSWASEVCERWGEVLDAIEGDPRTLTVALDWPIKHALYTDYIEDRGHSWERIAQVNFSLAELQRQSSELSASLVKRPGLVGENAVNGSTRLLRDNLERAGIPWDEFQDYWELRHELFEIDTRFALLGPNGIFHSMDAEGVLRHSAPGVNDIETAMTDPPAEGRAHARGELVKQLHGAKQSKNFVCGWQWVINLNDGRRVKLNDPFESNVAWTDPIPDDPQLPFSFMRRRRRSAENDIPF